jgi:hypothetical protein
MGGGSQACLVMVVTGACLMSPSPSGPGRLAGGAGHGRDGQVEEPRASGTLTLTMPGSCGAAFRGGGEDAGFVPVPRLPGRAAGGAWRGEGWWPGGGDGEQGERAHGQHGVSAEGGPEPDLVLVQASPFACWWHSSTGHLFPAALISAGQDAGWPAGAWQKNASSPDRWSCVGSAPVPWDAVAAHAQSCSGGPCSLELHERVSQQRAGTANQGCHGGRRGRQPDPEADRDAST